MSKAEWLWSGAASVRETGESMAELENVIVDLFKEQIRKVRRDPCSRSMLEQGPCHAQEARWQVVFFTSEDGKLVSSGW